MGNRILAGASSFAHLVGLSKPAAAKSKAEDDQDDKKEAARAESGDEQDDDDKKESARADGDDPKDDDADDKKDAKGKKAKPADEDDDDDKKPDAESDDDEEEMSGKSAAASARRRERARCAAIFAAPAAAHNVALAASLAFDTTLTRSQAITVLSKAPAAAPAAGRADRNPRLGPSGQATVNSKQAIAASWDAAAAKVPSRTRR